MISQFAHEIINYDSEGITMQGSSVHNASTAEVPAVPTVSAGCCHNFYQTFYQKWTTFDKNYQEDNLWGSFLLVCAID